MSGLNDTVISHNQRLKGDRRTEGLELAVSHISDNEFSEYFEQFEQVEATPECDSTDNTTEKWEINDYQVLYRKGAEFAYLTIVYKDQQHGDAMPALYAFRDANDDSIVNKETSPTLVHNIHGTDVYQSYLERGWEDITQSENAYPWIIKSWLAQHMKQDTIQIR